MYLITGGGSGIGQALAKALAKRNQHVLVIGRHEQSLQETAAFSPLIRYLSADVSTAKGREIINSNLDASASLKGLIHNAGIIDPIVPLATMQEPAWQQVMATNVNAPLFLTQMLLGKLKNGRVLHIGSGAAHFPISGWSAYCVSKAALSMLTQCFQLEITETAFSSVMPGIIDTPMQQKIRQSANGMEQEKHQFFLDLYQEKRLLSVETVALFLTWLLLDTKDEEYRAKEWDIYDQSHHAFWLIEPHQVPILE